MYLHMHTQPKNLLTIALTAAILLFIAIGVTFNYTEKSAVDESKLPEKVEDSNGFQRWITNLKNKDIEIDADGFNLVEKNEIYNTKWMTISSIDEPGKLEEFEARIAAHKDIKKVVFSPSERQYVDYRPELRDGYLPNELHFYGLRDDKIIDARFVDCSVAANCYFDRAWFLPNSNDVFVVSEFSRNIDKKDETAQACTVDEVCTYTFKLHLIDLINNSRHIYESQPIEGSFTELAPEL